MIYLTIWQDIDKGHNYILGSLVSLRIPLQNVKEVVVSIKLHNFEGRNQELKQLHELGFVWKKGSDFIRLQVSNCHYNLLDDYKLT